MITSKGATAPGNPAGVALVPIGGPASRRTFVLAALAATCAADTKVRREAAEPW